MISAEAPPPPETGKWIDLLHWALRAVPTEHPDLSFLASLLAQSIDRPGLTERQAKYATRITDRLQQEWEELHRARLWGLASANLATMTPAGRA